VPAASTRRRWISTTLERVVLFAALALLWEKSVEIFQIKP
jgi:hypothetical protein